MPNEDNKILKYNHGEKSLKAPAIIYADLDCLLEKMHSCENNLEKSYAEKKTKHTPSGYSLFTNCSFDATKNKLDCYKGEDCMEKFCKDLREHAMKIIDYEKKEMIPLTDEENKSYEKQKVCYICKKEFNNDDGNDDYKKYHKVKDHCHYTGKFGETAHSICNLKYKTPKEIPIVFHNGSTYDYHFIINKLAKEFDGQLECLGENTEKYITFSVPISKELDNGKTITYKLKFIDSFRFMSTSLSSLVDNLSEIYKKECKGCKERKKIEPVCDFIGLKNNKLRYKCEECKKIWLKPISGLIKKFLNIHQFYNGDINKFVLLLRKDVYSYEYMDSWERLYETSLSDNKILLQQIVSRRHY